MCEIGIIDVLREAFLPMARCAIIKINRNLYDDDMKNESDRIGGRP